MRRKHQAGEPSHGRTVTRGHLAHGGIILRGDLLHREHTREAESTRGRETNVAEPQKPRGDYVQKKREVDDVAVWLGGPRNFPANSQDHQQEAQAILVGRRPGGRGCSVCSGARGRCGTRAAPWCGADAARVAGRGRPGVRWTTGMCTAHPGRTRRCATTLSTPPACHAPRGGPCTTGGAGAPRRVTSRPQALADLGSAARTLTATAPEEQSPRCAQDLSLLSHNAAGLGERGRHTASAARQEPTSHMHSPDGTDQSSLARTPKHSRSLWLSDASQNETQHGH